MSQQRLNYGQIPTHHLHTLLLASIYTLLRTAGADPEDAGFFALLTGSLFVPHQHSATAP